MDTFAKSFPALSRQVVLLVAITAMLGCCMPLLSQNLINNGGFETATQGIPTGTPIPGYPGTLNSWTATNTDGEFILDPSRAHSGNGFLSVLQNNNASPGTYWLGAPFLFSGYDRAGQVVSVAPNTAYTLAFWYRGGDGSRYGYGPGNLKVHVEQIAPSNVGIANLTIPAPGVWQFYNTTITTGPGATQLIVLFSPQGPSNIDVWVDDVEFGVSVPLEESAEAAILAESPAMDLQLYPNPSRGDLFVAIPADYDWVSHAVYDLAGREIQLPFNKTESQLEIDAGTLESGMYLLKVQRRTTTELKKFVIER